MMNTVDRLIAKAKKIKLTSGDSVFIISNESGEWTVDGRSFPDLESAQAYVENLLSDDTECTVIINDLGPCDVEPLNMVAMPSDWLDRLKAENMKRIQMEQKKKRLNSLPKKDRRLI